MIAISRDGAAAARQDDRPRRCGRRPRLASDQPAVLPMAVAAVAPDLAFDVAQSPASLPPAVRAFMDKITVEADERLLADYIRAPGRRG